MSFKILFLVSMAIYLGGCTKNESTIDQSPSSVSASSNLDLVASNPEGEVIASEGPDVEQQPALKKLRDAQQIVKLSLEEMLREERFIEDAYRSHELATLERAALEHMQGAPNASLWEGDEFSPYLKCDTAWGDLGLYASALAHELRESNATRRQIVKKEQADYKRSKEACEQRLVLSPEKAWEEYEKS